MAAIVSTTERFQGRGPLAAITILAVTGQLFVLLASFGLLTPAAGHGIAIAAAIAILWTRPAPLILLLLLIPVAILACYPPFGFDETMYHLPFVDGIAKSGAIQLRDDVRFGVFPELHEALTVPLYRAFGGTGTHFVSVLELALLASLLLTRARTRLEGWLATAIVLGNPAMIAMSVVNYTDVALSLFVAAGLFCLWPEDDTPLTSRAVLLAGFLLGTSAAVKYLGWLFVAAGVLWAWRKLPYFAAGVLAGAGPMTAKLFALTGNPFHPFFVEGPFAVDVGPSPGSPFVRLARLLWDLTFARERLGWAVPFAPTFAIALLIVLFSRGHRRLAFVCVAYLVAFATVMPTDSRYLLPLVPLVAAAAAGIVMRWRVPKPALALAALVCIGPLLIYPAMRIRWKGWPPIDPAARHMLLLEQRAGVGFIPITRGDPVYGCGAEDLKWFYGERFRGDYFIPMSYRRVFINGGLATLPDRWFLVSVSCPPPWKAQIAAIARPIAQSGTYVLYERDPATLTGRP